MSVVILFLLSYFFLSSEEINTTIIFTRTTDWQVIYSEKKSAYINSSILFHIQIKLSSIYQVEKKKRKSQE